MPTINQLAPVSQLSGGDQIPIYVPNNGDARRTSVTQLTQFIEGNLVVTVDATEVTYTPPGSGAVPTTVQAKLRESVSVKDFGAVGDGVTDDRAAFAAAFAACAEKRLVMPSGRYRIPFTSTTALSFPANIELVGDGSETTFLEFVPSSTSYRNCMNLSPGVSISGATVTIASLVNGSASIFSGDCTNLTLTSCVFDGGVTNTGSTISHAAYLVNFPTSGTQTDILIDGCTITRFRYAYLKTNTSTSTQKRIRVVNCDHFNNYEDPCQFNSPSGVMDDILVQGCTFRDSLGVSASVTALHCSFASCSNFRVIGNHFSGAITDALHIEENCVNGIVTGNTLEIDGNGVTLQDNNIGGTYKMPLNVVVANNVVKKSGTGRESGKSGIHVIIDATPEVPAKRNIIESNIISGFFKGIQTGASTDDAVKISNNICHDCTNAFYVDGGLNSIDDNTSANSDVGVYTSNGGVITRHTFVECLNPVVSDLTHATIIDPVFEWSEFNVGAGSTTNKDMLPIGAADRMYCNITGISQTSGVNDRVTFVDSDAWDGTTFTKSNVLSLSPGSITLTTVNNSGYVALQLFSTSAKSGVRLSAHFSGTLAVSP